VRLVAVVGSGVDGEPVGLDGVSDPVLLAVQDPAVVRPLRRGRHPRQVAPRLRLGDREPRELLVRRHGLKEPFLLGLGAVRLDEVTAEAG
jgi:hypothetical protein